LEALQRSHEAADRVAVLTVAVVLQRITADQRASAIRDPQPAFLPSRAAREVDDDAACDRALRTEDFGRGDATGELGIGHGPDFGLVAVDVERLVDAVRFAE